MIEIETFAMDLHESFRDAVIQGLVVNNLRKPFLGWDEISDDAREGRRIQARYLMDRYSIEVRK